MFALSRDPGKLVEAIPALVNTPVTAGGSGDATDANGISIDLMATGRQKAEAILILAQATSVLGAAATMALAIRLQDSDTGSGGWVDVVDPRTPAAIFSATTTSTAGAATVPSVTKLSVPLEYCKRYVRVVATPNLSAANTDTATVQAIALLCGLTKV